VGTSLIAGLVMTGAACASGPGHSSSSTHFIIQGTRSLKIDTRTLESRDDPDSTLYEISDGDLYITPSDRSRYRYGAVSEAAPRRLVAEHFTIFVSADTLTVTLVHSNEQRIKITKARVLSHSVE
jgi:hypothetical protein